MPPATNRHGRPLPHADLPATVTLVPAADAWLREAYPGDPKGDATELSIDTSHCDGQVQALLRFDLSEIPEGSEVQSAVLTMHTTDGGKGAAIHRMLVAWDEDAMVRIEVTAGTRGPSSPRRTG